LRGFAETAGASGGAPRDGTRAATQGPILGALLRLAVPIVLANMLQSAYQLIDAFWVGRLGGAAVAAVAVTFPLTFLMFALGAGFSIAGSTLIAQYVGARNQPMVNRVAAQTLLLVAGVSLLLGLVGYGLAPLILRLMGVAADVYPGALQFMRISFLGLVFGFGFAVFQAVMRGVGEAVLPLWIVLATVVLNAALCPLLVFGAGPLPGLGVAGAALATVATQALALAAALVVLRRGRHGIQVVWADFRPDPAYMKRAFLLGFPASLEMSARALGITVLSFLVASFGTVAIAAYGVGTTLFQVALIPAMGLSMAVSVLVGQNIGAREPARAARIGRIGALLGFCGLTALGVAAYAVAPVLVATFIPGDPAVIAAGTAFVRTQCLAWGFVGLQLCLIGIFRAAGNMIANMVIALLSQWGLMLPIAWTLSKHTPLGIEGIWWAFPVANVLITLLTLLWYAKGNWRYARLTDDPLPGG
jgi:putative MATE family efflux protein